MSAHIHQELKARGVADVIVVLAQPIQASATSAPARTLSTLAAIGLAEHFTRSERAQISALAAAGAARQPGLSQAPAGKAPPQQRTASLPPVQLYPNLGILLGTVDRKGLAGLRGDSRVKEIVGAPPLSLIRARRSATGRSSRGVTWGIRELGIPALWKQGLTGQGIRIGHLDTGVDGSHPALAGAIAKFAEFDHLGVEVLPTPKPHDSAEHGTHTAGTIAGRPVNAGRFGVAPGASLVSAIVIEGGHVVARLLRGMDWAVGNGIRILNLSLGIRGFVEDFLPVTQILRSKGILPVFAVGDEGPGTSRSPGNYAQALSVGSLDQSGTIATDSSSQLFRRKTDPIVPDVVAPGVGVFSAKPGGGFQLLDGTSMATPHIAGLAALLMEAAPQKTVDEVEAAIFNSCRLKAGFTADRAGRGLPNAARALALL